MIQQPFHNLFRYAISPLPFFLLYFVEFIDCFLIDNILLCWPLSGLQSEGQSRHLHSDRLHLNRVIGDNLIYRPSRRTSTMYREQRAESLLRVTLTVQLNAKDCFLVYLSC